MFVLCCVVVLCNLARCGGLVFEHLLKGRIVSIWCCWFGGHA